MLDELDMEDFSEVLEELGEVVTFPDFAITQKAALKPNMLNKAIGTTDGAYWFTGLMTFDSMAQQEKLSGAYFVRETQPNVAFMLHSILHENPAPNLPTVNVVECNEKVDIVSHYESTDRFNEYGEEIKAPVYAAKNVDVYFTSFNKDARDLIPGAMEETIIYAIIPAKYKITNKTVIERTGFVFNDETNEAELGKIPYRVESIDSTMMDIVNGEPVGLVRCMLKESRSA